MVEDKRSGRNVRWSARIAFAAGVAASVAANIAAAHPTLGARIVAAWPAVAMLLVVEMLSRARPRVPVVVPHDHDEPAESSKLPERCQEGVEGLVREVPQRRTGSAATERARRV